MSKTLVIIDMQDEFMDEDERDLLPIICKLIQHAKQNKWPIILVRFVRCGRIDRTILREVRNYQHKTTVTKSNPDGGYEVIKCINKNEWPLNIFVCGVWGNECVSETVAGLFYNSDVAEVSVVTDAIYPSYYSSSEPDEHGQRREAEVVSDSIVSILKVG